MFQTSGRHPEPFSFRRVPLGAPAAGALVLVLVGEALQPGRHLLLGLHQDVQEVLRDVAVLVVEERRCQT